MLSDQPLNDDQQHEPPEEDNEPLPQRVTNAPAAEPEQIGPLTFVPNAEYPYPFKVAVPPRFWMEETSGALNDAVDTYMGGKRLSSDQINVIRIYLRQFIERAVLSGDANKKVLLGKIDKLKTTADVERFADEVAEYGAEVF